MTFIVSEGGVVYQKDLGRKTDVLAKPASDSVSLASLVLNEKSVLTPDARCTSASRDPEVSKRVFQFLAGRLSAWKRIFCPMLNREIGPASQDVLRHARVGDGTTGEYRRIA
jgi:Protein of unknown function (DUF2950)